jgi:hypothetical protein
MKTNNYTFKAWHNGAGAHYVYDVQANDIREAYKKAYDINHSTPGTESDVELLAASTLQVWEVGLCVKVSESDCVTAPTKFPMFFTIQAYSEPEAIAAAEQHRSVEYPDDYSILYVEHKREVK